jgi:hypothetical protein
VQAEAAAARGILSLVWATAAFWGGLAAVARVLFVVVLFVLAPLAAVTPVLPWGGGLLRGWAADFLSAGVLPGAEHRVRLEAGSTGWTREPGGKGACPACSGARLEARLRRQRP